MCILYLLAQICVLHSLSHILYVCVFPKHNWGAGGSELIHGRKIQMDLIFSSVRFEFEFSGRSAAASFLPFYTHCIFSLWIYHDFESDKNILKKTSKKEIAVNATKQNSLGLTILHSWHFHIFTRSHTLRGSTSRKSLLHKFSGQFTGQQVGRGWKCALSSVFWANSFWHFRHLDMGI